MDAECVDLVYLDPPFKSNQDYNMLYRERDGSRSAAQLKAFSDTWTWDPKAAKTYRQVVEAGGAVSDAMDAFRRLLISGSEVREHGRSEMLAYLSMMAPRLIELRRVLKPTGSLYLHCDPNASHYLKLLLDSIFGPEQFLSEVIWRRTGTHSSAKRWGPIHDTLLVYARTFGRQTWNRPYAPLSEKHKKRHYRLADAAGRVYTHGELTAPGVRHGRSGTTWRGFDVTAIGRHWCTTVDKLEILAAQGRIYFPEDGSWPRLIRYEDESKGRAIGDVWEDIAPLNMRARERLGFPTQKPVALLKRIIAASTNEGDTVLDPFCGCGSTIEAADELRRKWIGIDITHLAVEVIEDRLAKRGVTEGRGYIEDSRFAPRTLPDIQAMARKNKYAFQGWALQQAGVEPFQLKPGPDRGIDARKVFFDPAGSNERREIIVSVKGGHLPPTCVRDLIGTVQRERAQIGVLITLTEPTRNMIRDAAEAPTYRGSDGRIYSGIQILTVRALLDGLTLEYPLQIATAKEPVVPTVPGSFTLEAQPIPRRMAKATLPLGFQREEAQSRRRGR